MKYIKEHIFLDVILVRVLFRIDDVETGRRDEVGPANIASAGATVVRVIFLIDFDTMGIKRGNTSLNCPISVEIARDHAATLWLALLRASRTWAARRCRMAESGAYGRSVLVVVVVVPICAIASGWDADLRDWSE